MPSVLITGASKGIGRATARLFANSGWDLLLLSRDEDSLKSLTAELNSTTDSTVYYKSIDLSKTSSLEQDLSILLDKGLTPSVLINNAGSAWTGDLLSMEVDKWQWLVQMNLTSVFQVTRTVVPIMRKKGGLVINVSSHAANNAFPQWGAYCTLKAALAAFTKCLAEEERVNSIRTCTLTLGSVNSSLWDSETVQSDFDRSSMLSEEAAANALLYMAEQPSDQVIEDLILMPSKGAF